MSIQYYTELYPTLPPITLYRDNSRWAKVARYTDANQLKLLTYANIKESKSYVSSFVNHHKNVIMFPLVFSDAVLGFGFKSLTERGFHILPAYPFCLYSATRTINHFNSKKEVPYNSTIILSEGVLDAEFFGLFGDFSFAYLKAKLDSFQVQVISLITKNVIICPDNDKPGRISVKPTIRNFKRFGVVPKFIKIPNEYGDPGELILSLIKKERNAYVVKEAIKQEIEILTKEARGYGEI